MTRTASVVADTYWQERRNNHDDIASVLMANSVTGAASLFRRELLDHALPFPPGQFHHFHDHWLGSPLWRSATINSWSGRSTTTSSTATRCSGTPHANRMTRLGERFRGWRRPLRDRVRLWRLTYFVDACRLLQFADDPPSCAAATRWRRPSACARRFARADRSLLPLGWLAARAAREFAGRPETLGAELGLLFGFTWRHAVGASVRAGSRRARVRLDTARLRGSRSSPAGAVPSRARCG